jgi:hypothetical protein
LETVGAAATAVSQILLKKTDGSVWNVSFDRTEDVMLTKSVETRVWIGVQARAPSQMSTLKERVVFHC